MLKVNTKKLVAWGSIIVILFAVIGIITLNQRTSAQNTEPVNFSFPGLNGGTVSLQDFKGKVVIVDVWATWCGPCRQEIPGFIKLYDKYKDKGLEIIGLAVDQDGAAAVKPFAEENKINYHLAIADMKDVEKIFGPIPGIPKTFLIDKEGKIVKQFIGAWPESEFEKAFLALVNPPKP